MSVQVTFLGMYRMQFVFTSANMSALTYTLSSAVFPSHFAAPFFLSSHWLQTWNNVFDQFFTQIAIRKYLNYDLPFLPFSDPSRFPTSGPRARRHKFKKNTYTYNIRSRLEEMIQSAFRLLQTRIKNRMAFTQIEWIWAITELLKFKNK